MAKSSRQLVVLFSLFIILAFLSGCGGGGSGETPVSGGPAPLEPFPSKILSWQPPTRYLDDTPLEPARELANIELYIKGGGGFTENDTPTALISAVNPTTGQPNTTFNLANLGAFLSRGVTYQVALRAVAINGAKSAFSTPAAFSF